MRISECRLFQLVTTFVRLLGDTLNFDFNHPQKSKITDRCLKSQVDKHDLTYKYDRRQFEARSSRDSRIVVVLESSCIVYFELVRTVGELQDPS